MCLKTPNIYLILSSKGSRIENQKIPDEIIENESKMEELETNKFWDFSRNIDLEDFDTQRVYRILMNQDRFQEINESYSGLIARRMAFIQTSSI